MMNSGGCPAKEVFYESRNEGIEKGRQSYLIQNICKKLRKGKNAEMIAEELEEDVEIIRNICETAKVYALEYEEEKILKSLYKSSFS